MATAGAVIKKWDAQPVAKPAVAPKAPVAAAPQAAAPRPAPAVQNQSSAFNALQSAAITGQPIAQQASSAPIQGQMTSGWGTPAYTPAPGGALGGLQQASAPGNTNITQVDGKNLGREMDALNGGVGGPLRTDLGTRTPPSLAALLQGLRY